MFLQTTLAVQCRSFTMAFVAVILSMILDAVIGVAACTSSSWSGRVDLCRVLTASDRSWVFRRFSRHIAQPPRVDDL